MDTCLIADDATVAKLAARLVRCALADAGRRYVVGIAGIGASGKSTLAARLVTAVATIRPGMAQLVPMDGFHWPNVQLDAWGLRDRKGSPQTFDAEGYLRLVETAGDGTGRVVFPIYDRELHEPVWRDVPSQTLEGSARLVITEGNYLLLDEPPWSRLACLLDECWWLDVPTELAEQRMIARHMRGGRSREAALAHYERSDRHNAELIQSRRREPDLSLRWP